MAVTMLDLNSAALRANPYPVFADLRERMPVAHTVLPGKGPAWLLTRYEDVLKLLKDERFAKDPRNVRLQTQQWVPPMLRPLTYNMLDLDAPDHGRLRGLVHKAFTPRLIETMSWRVQTLADELINAAERRGHMDLISDFAFVIPITIIAEILGVPAEDRGKFRRWSNAAIEVRSVTSLALAMPAIMMFTRYLRHQIALRRQNPTDDLISLLVQAEEAGDKLSEDELLGMIFLLLLAGHETTVNLIGNGTLALLQHPEQLALLRRQPELLKPAVEELLRFYSPVHLATERYAREDMLIHGVAIRRGELMLGAIASANRDESQFSNPDVLDIRRENNKHLAFGQGVHYCLGAPLARLEGHIALATLIRRLPDLRLNISADKLRWRKSLFIRGLESLPVKTTK